MLGRFLEKKTSPMKEAAFGRLQKEGGPPSAARPLFGIPSWGLLFAGISQAFKNSHLIVSNVKYSDNATRN